MTNIKLHDHLLFFETFGDIYLLSAHSVNFLISNPKNHMHMKHLLFLYMFGQIISYKPNIITYYIMLGISTLRFHFPKIK